MNRQWDDTKGDAKKLDFSAEEQGCIGAAVVTTDKKSGMDVEEDVIYSDEEVLNQLTHNAPPEYQRYRPVDAQIIPPIGLEAYFG